MLVKAELKNYRQSPRKVRLVVDQVRGKSALEAIDILTFTAKKASDPIIKLVESAVANAKNNFSLEPENLFVKEIMVDEGVTMHRWRARARGSAAPIRKRSSHVKVVLSDKDSKKKEDKKDKE